MYEWLNATVQQLRVTDGPMWSEPQGNYKGKPLVELTCNHCGKTFQGKAARFCSTTCYYRTKHNLAPGQERVRKVRVARKVSKECINCHKLFVAYPKAKRCDACRPIPLVERDENNKVACTCIVCGTEFRAMRTDAKTCSPTCKNKYGWQQRVVKARG